MNTEINLDLLKSPYQTYFEENSPFEYSDSCGGRMFNTPVVFSISLKPGEKLEVWSAE